MSYRKGLKNEFELAMVNEQSVFELLRFDCRINDRTKRWSDCAVVDLDLHCSHIALRSFCHVLAVMTHVKRKRSVEHAQNMCIHIIRCMRKVSSGPLLSSYTFYSIQWFRLRAVKALIRVRGCAGWSGPSLSAYARIDVFEWRCPNNVGCDQQEPRAGYSVSRSNAICIHTIWILFELNYQISESLNRLHGGTVPLFTVSTTKISCGLGGSFGCAVRLEIRRSRVQPPPRSATFFRGDWSWNIFYGHSLPSADSRRAVISLWRKNVHNTG